jgi:hypothetical protein
MFVVFVIEQFDLKADRRAAVYPLVGLPSARGEGE